jgi:hypothetical protein
MKVGSADGVISGLSPGTEKAGEDLYTTYVSNETTDTIIIIKEDFQDPNFSQIMTKTILPQV